MIIGGDFGGTELTSRDIARFVIVSDISCDCSADFCCRSCGIGGEMPDRIAILTGTPKLFVKRILCEAGVGWGAHSLTNLPLIGVCLITGRFVIFRGFWRCYCDCDYLFKRICTPNKMFFYGLKTVVKLLHPNYYFQITLKLPKNSFQKHIRVRK